MHSDVPTPSNAHESVPRSLIGRLTAFVVIGCLSLVLFQIWQAYRGHEDTLHDAEINSSNIANAIALQTEAAFRQADVALIEIAERIESEGTSPEALDRLQETLRKRTAVLPEIQGLFAINELGWAMATSLPDSVAKANYSDRQYFQFHQLHGSQDVYIGEPVISKTSGVWVVTVSRRLQHTDGSFAGLALATIKLDYFATMSRQFNMGKDGVIAIAFTDGNIMYRQPFESSVIGKSVRNSILFTQYISQATDGYATVRSAVDGIERISGFRYLEHYPIVAIAGLSKLEVLQRWRGEVIQHSVAVVLLVLALAILGMRMLGQIRTRAILYRELLQTKDALQFLNHRLEEMAMQDGLTGLANRRRFDLTFEEEFRRAERMKSPIALIMIDADHFKRFNDTYGHSSGDDCLRFIASSIQSSTGRTGDLAARFGGEEMVVLLPNTALEGALTVAERLRGAIEQLQIPHSGNSHRVVTISVGVASVVPGPQCPRAEDLLERADQGLYKAKQQGRNQVCGYHPAGTELSEHL